MHDIWWRIIKYGVFSIVPLKITSVIFHEEIPQCCLRPLTLDKTRLGFFEPKNVSKTIVYTKILQGWLKKVVEKTLVSLKFGLPSNPGPVDICTFHFMALTCGQIFQKEFSTLAASHADVVPKCDEALRTSAGKALFTSKMGYKEVPLLQQNKVRSNLGPELTRTVRQTARHNLSVWARAAVASKFGRRIITLAHALSFARSTLGGAKTPHVPWAPVSVHCNTKRRVSMWLVFFIK